MSQLQDRRQYLYQTWQQFNGVLLEEYEKASTIDEVVSLDAVTRFSSRLMARWIISCLDHPGLEVRLWANKCLLDYEALQKKHLIEDGVAFN